VGWEEVEGVWSVSEQASVARESTTSTARRRKGIFM
jgi:hypothetical protein